MAMIRYFLLAIIAASAYFFPSTDVEACTLQSERNWRNCADAGEAAYQVSSAMWDVIANCNVRNVQIFVEGNVVKKNVTYGGDGTTAVCGMMYPQTTGVAAATFLDACTVRNSRYPPGDMQPALAQPPSDCYGGCKLAGTSVTSTTGGITIYGVINRYYTGDICTKKNDSNAPIDAKEEKEAETKPKAPECTALGNGQTSCSMPNGNQCATASTGKTFCWKPSETGKKVDGEDAQVKGKKGEPVTPPDVKIEDKDWQRKEGHQQTTCVNNTCTTYNVTNFQTAPSGTAKNSTGDNNSDGSGNTTGNGKPSKGDDDGKDKDDGDSAADSGSCEAPPSCTGDTLKCLHLRYTWKTECNTRPSEMTKGDGCGENDVPICAGSSCKAEAYAGVLQQWKQRCAMQALGEGMASRAGGISNGDDAGVLDGIWGGESGGTGLTLRQDLINVGGGGGSLLPDVEIEGQSWNVPAGFYDAIAAIRLVIIAMCTVIAMFVVGRSI